MLNTKTTRSRLKRMYWDQSVTSGRLFQAGNGNYVSSTVYTGNYLHDIGPKARHAPLLDINHTVSLSFRQAGGIWLKLANTLTPEGSAALGTFLKSHHWGRISESRRSIAFTVPVFLVESTTKGHFHLYIEATLSGIDHQRFIECCYFAGIIDEKYAKMVKKIGKAILLRPGRRRTIVSRY